MKKTQKNAKKPPGRQKDTPKSAEIRKGFGEGPEKGQILAKSCVECSGCHRTSVVFPPESHYT